MRELIIEICNYIIATVQSESIPELSGFQYVVTFQDICTKFSTNINKQIQLQILDHLLCRKEVADVILDNYGFDVVLYTDYAPNYMSEFFDA